MTLSLLLLSFLVMSVQGTTPSFSSSTVTFQLASNSPKINWFPGTSADGTKYYTMFYKSIAEVGVDGQEVTNRYFPTIQDGPVTFTSMDLAPTVDSANMTMTFSVGGQTAVYTTTFFFRKIVSGQTNGAVPFTVPQYGLQAQISVTGWNFASPSNSLKLMFDLVDGYESSWTSQISGSTIKMPGPSHSGAMTIPLGCLIDNNSTAAITASYSPQGGSDRMTIVTPSFNQSLQFSYVLSLGAVLDSSASYSSVNIALSALILLVSTMMLMN